jgi:hypothetical protein
MSRRAMGTLFAFAFLSAALLWYSSLAHADPIPMPSQNTYLWSFCSPVNINCDNCVAEVNPQKTDCLVSKCDAKQTQYKICLQTDSTGIGDGSCNINGPVVTNVCVNCTHWKCGPYDAKTKTCSVKSNKLDPVNGLCSCEDEGGFLNPRADQHGTCTAGGGIEG